MSEGWGRGQVEFLEKKLSFGCNISDFWILIGRS